MRKNWGRRDSHPKSKWRQSAGEVQRLNQELSQPLVRCLYAEYGRENQQRRKRSPTLRLVSGLNRLIVLIFGAYLCNVDLEARLAGQLEPSQPYSKTRSRWGLLKQSSWRRELKFGWISQLVVGLFLVLLCHLLAVTYYQYSFDLNLIESHSNEAAPSLRARLGIGSNLTSGMKVAEQRLYELASSAFIHQTMIMECVYVSLATFALMIYFTPLICHRFLIPFDFGIIRELLNSTRELLSVNSSLERVVADFMESSRMFMSSRAILMKLDSHSKQRCRLADCDGDEQLGWCPPNQEARIASMSHQTKLGKLLDDMLDRSALMPLNKRPNSLWPLARAILQLFCHVSILFYSIVFDILIIWGSFIWPNSRSLEYEPLPLNQSLAMFSSVGLLLINMPSVSLFAPVYFVATIDQIWFTNKLIKLVEQCIESNRVVLDTNSNSILELGDREQRLNSRRMRLRSKSIIALQPRQRKKLLTKAPLPLNSKGNFNKIQNEDQARTMNSNLIFVLLHYRIFLDQFGPIRVALTASVSGTVALMFLMPIIIRIHIDYIMQIHVDPASTSSFRCLAAVLSASVLLPANFILIPLCYLNSRCRKLCEKLASLMAHIIRVRAQPNGEQLYDQHSVTVLQKELSHPNHMINQFVIRSFLLDGTYETLIKAHFWWSFLMISILIDVQTGKRQDSLILTLLSDPFRLNGHHRTQSNATI